MNETYATYPSPIGTTGCDGVVQPAEVRCVFPPHQVVLRLLYLRNVRIVALEHRPQQDWNENFRRQYEPF